MSDAMLVEAIKSKLGAPSDALTPKEIAKLGGIGDGRPLPGVVGEMLALRKSAWDFPGMWVKAKPSSLRGMSFLDLLKVVIERPDFRPASYWATKRLALQLPGGCYPLGLDQPAPFYYVAYGVTTPDYPVLRLVQSDDALEVVAEAPSLAAYFAMKAGVLPSPKYVGGLAADPSYREAMLAALKAHGLSFQETGSRLSLEADRKEPSDRFRGPVTGQLPRWVKNHCAPWLSLAEMAWKKIQAADDKALMTAFAACQRDAGTVKAKQAKFLRRQLGLEEEYGGPPVRHLCLFFALAYELEPDQGSALLYAVLNPPGLPKFEDPYYDMKLTHLDIVDWLLEVAARRLYDEESFWQIVLAHGPTTMNARDSDVLYVLGGAIAKSRLFSDESCFARIEDYLKVEPKMLGEVATPSPEGMFIAIFMIALLLRNLTYQDRVLELGDRYIEVRRSKGLTYSLDVLKQGHEKMVIRAKRDRDELL